MNDEVLALMPDSFPKDIYSALATLAVYEALGTPIKLKNGSTMEPKGFVRFLGAEEWAGRLRDIA